MRECCRSLCRYGRDSLPRRRAGLNVGVIRLRRLTEIPDILCRRGGHAPRRIRLGIGVAIVITIGIEKPVAIKADPAAKEAAAKAAAVKTPAPETSTVTSESSPMTSTPTVTSVTSTVGFGSPNANRGTEGQSNNDDRNQELAAHETHLFISPSEFVYGSMLCRQSSTDLFC